MTAVGEERRGEERDLHPKKLRLKLIQTLTLTLIDLRSGSRKRRKRKRRTRRRRIWKSALSLGDVKHKHERVQDPARAESH